MKKLLSVLAITGMLALTATNVFAAQDTSNCHKGYEDCPKTSEECLKNQEDCPMNIERSYTTKQTRSVKTTNQVKNGRMMQGRNCHN
ncbi:hypothetical protein [Anaerorhabdus furcosa]|uniref:Uncharacterized protein n=1 Tax=Anaerorhabdus furcosa TaxID=118967 RepID=A0A1T4NWX2_9FIRM|nr:hypothetical protein [Anaerorhabdus furcosa]SJZ83721.1 hypothetical protein SAMN02745191_1768 [Anaerorhabdus furcosa]